MNYKTISIFLLMMVSSYTQAMKRSSVHSKSIFAKSIQSLHNIPLNPTKSLASARLLSSQAFVPHYKRYHDVLPFVFGISLGCGLAYQAHQIHADDSSDSVTPEPIFKETDNENLTPLTYTLFQASPNKKLLIQSMIAATPTADILYKNPAIFAFIDDYLFSNNSCERDPSLINHLNSLISHYFDQFSIKEKLDETSKIRLDKLFYRLIGTDEDKKRIISMAKKNIYLTSEITILAHLLYDKLASKNQDIELINEIGQSIFDNYATIEKTKFGLIFASICLENSPLLQEKFIKIVEQSVAHASPFTIALASKYSPCNSIIKAYLEQQNVHNENKVLQSMKTRAYVDHCKEECSLLEKNPKTRTLIHIQKEINNIEPELLFRTNSILPSTLIPHYLFHQWQHDFSLYDSSINQMIEQIVNKELELKSNYYTFFHGQRKSYLPYIQLHTFLQQTLNKMHYPQHLSIHIPQDYDHKNIKNEKKLRNNLLSKGTSSMEDIRRLLFTNWAFFANASSYGYGASSAYYVANNKNSSDHITLTAEQVFIVNNIHHLFPKYKNRIEQLIQEFEEATHYGTCLLLAIPKNSIDKHIFLGQPYGEKTKINIEGFGETDDISIIMKILETSPERIKNTDTMEFCIPMTYDKKGALNPQSGIKFFAFTPANSSAMDAWYTQMYNLFDEIAADIKDKKNINN